jgi:hypothetical protein
LHIHGSIGQPLVVPRRRKSAVVAAMIHDLLSTPATFLLRSLAPLLSCLFCGMDAVSDLGEEDLRLLRTDRGSFETGAASPDERILQGGAAASGRRHVTARSGSRVAPDRKQLVH